MNKVEKKYLRSIASYYKYDNKLIEELDSVSCNNTPPVSVYGKTFCELLNFIKSKPLINENSIFFVVKKLFDLDDKSVVSLDKVTTLKTLLLNEDNYFSLFNFIKNDRCFKGKEGQLFSILLNIKNYSLNEKLTVIASGHYKELLLASNSYPDFAGCINDLIESTKNIIYTTAELTLEEIKSRLNNLSAELLCFLKVSEIRIFGSYANGTQNANSDFDFLIITDDKNHDNSLTRSLLGAQFEALFGEHFDIVALDVNQGRFDLFDVSIVLKSIKLKKYDII